jgi:hypothetical protein
MMSRRFSSLAVVFLIALGVAATGSQAQAKHYSAWDEQWLKTSIEGDRFEIAGRMTRSRWAQTRRSKRWAQSSPPIT